MNIQNVSDTARWVAVYRAMESERPDALFHDPWARSLAGEHGESIVQSMPRGAQMAWAMIVRTAVFDEMILDTIHTKQVDCVLNLAAGLDTRAWRLDLPPALHWIDADLPGILDYKTERMRDVAPKCAYDAERTDLTDPAQRDALFQRVGGAFQRVLVVTEGLLVYLTADDVGALAKALHEQPSFRWWLMDLASPRLLDWMRDAWGKQVSAGNAPFLFGPEEGASFFAPFGWREAVWRGTIEEAHRLKREMRGMWLWRTMMRLSSPNRREEFRRFAGYLLLERT
jgi:methyltransferase (TIGR00027 family)